MVGVKIHKWKFIILGHEVNIQEYAKFFGSDTANESTLFRKHIKQKTREVA